MPLPDHDLRQARRWCTERPLKRKNGHVFVTVYGPLP